MTDSDKDLLERGLRELGRWTALPPTPDLTFGVAERIRGERPNRVRLLQMQRRTFLAAAAAVLVLLAGLSLISGTVRDAVADALGIPGIRIEIKRDEPTATASTPPELNLGVEIALEDASDSAGFSVMMLAPVDVGPPDAIFVRSLPDGVTLMSMVYLPTEDLPNTAETGVGALLMQFESEYAVPTMAKSMRIDGKLEEVQINGARGFWLEGSSQLQIVGDATESRSSGNVLIWQANGVTYRLESALTKEAAVALAESMIAVPPTLPTPRTEPT